MGTNYDGKGANFSIFSEVAEQVDLCLYDKGEHVEFGLNKDKRKG